MQKKAPGFDLITAQIIKVFVPKLLLLITSQYKKYIITKPIWIYSIQLYGLTSCLNIELI